MNGLFVFADAVTRVADTVRAWVAAITAVIVGFVVGLFYAPRKAEAVAVDPSKRELPMKAATRRLMGQADSPEATPFKVQNGLSHHPP